MEKEPREIFFCREHNGVACSVKKNGIPIGEMCSEGGEWLRDEDMVEGVAWILLWSDLGYDEDPITNLCKNYDTGTLSDETP